MTHTIDILTVATTLTSKNEAQRSSALKTLLVNVENIQQLPDDGKKCVVDHLLLATQKFPLNQAKWAMDTLFSLHIPLDKVLRSIPILKVFRERKEKIAYAQAIWQIQSVEHIPNLLNAEKNQPRSRNKDTDGKKRLQDAKNLLDHLLLFLDSSLAIWDKQTLDRAYKALQDLQIDTPMDLVPEDEYQLRKTIVSRFEDIEKYINIK